MNATHRFNGLNGNTVTRTELQEIVDLAKIEEQKFVIKRLENLLQNNPDESRFKIKLKETAIEVAPEGLLHCFDCETEFTENEIEGLGRVAPADIYQMITDKMIAAIKAATGSGYKKKWKNGYVTGEDGKPLEGYLVPHNFVTKKPYRGINLWLLSNLVGLQVMPLENPFYLTFKQIEKLGGTLKKGSQGKEVVYFTMLYKIKTDKLDFATYDKDKFIDFLINNGYSKKDAITEIQKSKIPILRYYNVFNGVDIEGIDFKLNSFKSGYVIPEQKKIKQERIELAELIVKNYPNPKPEYKEGNSDKAYYSPVQDLVRMPHFDSFETSQDYYRTLFHEYIHSTGNESRLSRDFSGRFGSKPYAKEELVAEFGAIFLSAQAGIIWHSNKNHSEYLKNWHNVLGIIEEDNRFLMRAASDAQRAADFILQPDNEGNPLFLKEVGRNAPKKENKPKANLPKTEKRKIVTKADWEEENHKLPKVKRIKAEVQSNKKFSKEKSGLNAPSYTVLQNPIVNDVLAWAEKNLYGKHIYHNDIGKKIHFSQSGIKKAIYGKRGISKIRLQLVYVAKQFLQSSRLITVEKDKKDRNRVLNIYKLNSFHTINGQEYKIFIVIRETESGILYYDHEGVKIKKHVQQTGGNSKENKSTPLSTPNVLSENKDTKKGLEKPNLPSNNEKALEQLKKLGFQKASEPVKDAPNTFVLPGEIGNFLQTQQSHKSLILIKGPKHSSKTQVAMQVANAFGEMGEVVAYIDYEQGGLESKDTQNSIKWNTSEKGLKNIMIKGYLENPLEELKEFCKYCKVIVADSVTDLKITADELNDLRCDYPEVHWVFISQVKENGEMYGGNKMAHNPTVIIDCAPAIDPKDRIATLIKNRGNDLSLKYNIFHKKLIKEPKPKKEIKSTKNQKK